MKDLKTVAVVVAGVFAAGYLMHMFRDVDIVKSAINGFDA